jgi:hypothetical protein
MDICGDLNLSGKSIVISGISGVYRRGEGEPHSRRTSPVWDQQVFKRKG